MGKSNRQQILISVYGGDKVGKYSLTSFFEVGWVPEKTSEGESYLS